MHSVWSWQKCQSEVKLFLFFSQTAAAKNVAWPKPGRSQSGIRHLIAAIYFKTTCYQASFYQSYFGDIFSGSISSGVVVKKLVMCFDRAISRFKVKMSCVIKEETELYNIVYPGK